MRRFNQFQGITLLVLNLAVAPKIWAQSPAAVAPAPAYREDRILVMPKPDAAIASLHSQWGAEVLARFPGLGGLQTVAVPPGETVATLIAKYQASGLVDYAEPDFFRYLNATPNDPKYTDGTLWGLHNFGQSGGLADADIDAPEAWDVQSSASNIVVAVLDTGIRYTHEDLAANMWTNPVDGSFGLNTVTGTTNVMDDNGHGTLVSGVLGAVGNNGKGVVGVAWSVQLMAAKCFNSTGGSSDSFIIASIDHARTNGAHVMVAPFDSPGYSASLSNAIYAAREAGIIFVTSVGNNAVNIDASPRYPACYDIDNVVAVTATTRTDTLLSVANYGATNVDLAAPGESIHTTWSPSDNFYTSLFSGTSYSAPYVAGAIALLKERFPTETHQELIGRVLNGVDPLPALAGKCVTGGRLNLRKALSPPIQLTLLSTAPALPLQLRVHAGPNRSCVIEVTTNLTTWSPIFTNTTSAAGTFDFADNVGANSPGRFFRAISTL
jgi:subtilisin family serine protease